MGGSIPGGVFEEVWGELKMHVERGYGSGLGSGQTDIGRSGFLKRGNGCGNGFWKRKNGGQFKVGVFRNLAVFGGIVGAFEIGERGSDNKGRR